MQRACGHGRSQLSAGPEGVVSTVPAYPNAWVRLTRVGNILTAYWSTNNAATWTVAATNDPAVVSTTGRGDLPATVYVGICTTAHNNDAIPNPSPLLYLDTVDLRQLRPAAGAGADHHDKRPTEGW